MLQAQTFINRAGQANTVQDARLAALYNFILPRYTDTTQANTNIGTDSCGALIYIRSTGKIYKRLCNPKKWQEIFTETDPFFTISPAYYITDARITHWDSTYLWGNHAIAGYASTIALADSITDLKSAIATKTNNSDTAAMMAAAPRVQRFLDSITNVKSSIATKTNNSDTAAMMAAAPRVQRFLDSVTNLKTSISTKQNTLTLTTTGTSGAATLTGATINIPQYSGSNIGNANLTLTGTRTLTNAGYQLSFLGGFESAVNFQNALKLETSTTAKESIELELNNTYTSTGKRFRFRNLAAGYMDVIGAANTRIMTFNSTPFVTVGATVTRISDAIFSVYGSIATSQGMQITGSITSPTGSGIELENQGGTTYFTSYNRSGSWLPAIFRSGELNIQNNGTQSAKVFTNGNWAIQNGGTFSDIASARLQINSTTQGFLPPRMTTTQINAISSPAVGLVVYNTTLNVLCVFTGTWQKMTTTTM